MEENLLESLALSVGEKIAAKLGAEPLQCGILARRAYMDNSFVLIGTDGEKLTPRGDIALRAYHLPGDRVPADGVYSGTYDLKLTFSMWLFGSEEISEAKAWSLCKSIQAVNRVCGKQVELKVNRYTSDIMKIIQGDFPTLKDQFQDKQTITTAYKYEYSAVIRKCC